MATVADERVEIVSLADLLDRLGGISPDRVCARPAPGMAVEADVIRINDRTNRIFELIDGTLVEKAMGFPESLLAGYIVMLLNQFVLPRNLGLVAGADGMMRIAPGLVLIPDVSFCSWDRFPGRRYPTDALPDLVPDLGVEVLSKGNTKREMARKRGELFAVGTRLVWEFEPKTRIVRVYTAPDRFATLSTADTLDGGDVLPGFVVPLADLFGMLDRSGDA